MKHDHILGCGGNDGVPSNLRRGKELSIHAARNAIIETLWKC